MFLPTLLKSRLSFLLKNWEMWLHWVRSHVATIYLSSGYSFSWGRREQSSLLSPAHLANLNPYFQTQLNLNLSYRFSFLIFITAIVSVSLLHPIVSAILFTWNLLPVENLPHCLVMNSSSIFAWKLVEFHMTENPAWCWRKQKRNLLASNWKIPPFSIAKSIGSDDVIRTWSSSVAGLFPCDAFIPNKLSPYGGKMQDSGQNLCFYPLSSKSSIKKKREKRKEKKELVFLVACAKFPRLAVVVSK